MTRCLLLIGIVCVYVCVCVWHTLLLHQAAPTSDARAPSRDVDSGAGDDASDDSGASGGVVDRIAAVRAQMRDLLLAHPGGLLGSQIPGAYQLAYHQPWKVACGGLVSSLSDLLATPQFYRIVDATGTINRFFGMEVVTPLPALEVRPVSCPFF